MIINNNNKDEINNFNGELDMNNLPVRLLNVVIISGIIVKDSPRKSIVNMKNGDTIDKIQFVMEFCSKNNVIDSQINVEALGSKSVNELEKLLEQSKNNRLVTVTGSLGTLFGPSLVKDSRGQFMLNANKVNIQSFAIDFETIDLNNVQDDQFNSENTPWGI